MSNTMRAVLCEEPKKIDLVELPIPEPKAGEVLIRIKRIGVCGTDLHAYLGQQNFLTYPRIFGHELSAEVVSLPEGTDTDLKAGDRVIVIPYISCGHCVACRHDKPNCCEKINVLGVNSDGGMCEYMTVPAVQLVRCNSLTWEQMALVECLSIGAHGVARANVQAASTVVVIGTGAIGIGAIQFAQANGANVIAVDIDEHRLNFCAEQLKVSATINARDNVQQKLSELTNGDMAFTVFDVTGNVHSMTQAFNYVSHAGTLVFIGHIKGDITFNEPEFHKREMTLMALRNATRADFERVVQAIESGQVEVDCMISDRVALSDVVGRFPYWLNPENRVIKAVIDMEV